MNDTNLALTALEAAFKSPHPAASLLRIPGTAHLHHSDGGSPVAVCLLAKGLIHERVGQAVRTSYGEAIQTKGSQERVSGRLGVAASSFDDGTNRAAHRANDCRS